MEKTKKNISDNETAEKNEKVKAEKTARQAMAPECIDSYVRSRYAGVSCVTLPTYSFYCELDEGIRFNSCRIILVPKADCFQVVVELPMRVMCWETAEMTEYLDEINSTCLEGYEGFWTDPISEKMYYRLLSERPAEEKEIELLVNKARKTVSEYLSDINRKLGDISKDYEPNPKGTDRPGSTGGKAKPKGIMNKLLCFIGLVDSSEKFGEESDEDNGNDTCDE